MKLYNLFDDKKRAVYVFGRFQPPTAGHQKLLNKAIEIAEEISADLFVVPSRTYDRKNNPISFSDKKKFIESICGVSVHDDETATNPFKMAKWLGEQGYDKVVFVVGSDRIQPFSELEEYWPMEFGGEFCVVSAGDRDPDSNGVAGISGSKMRDFVRLNDFDSFRQGLPEKVDEKISHQLFNTLKENIQ